MIAIRGPWALAAVVALAGCSGSGSAPGDGPIEASHEADGGGGHAGAASGSSSGSGSGATDEPASGAEASAGDVDVPVDGVAPDAGGNEAAVPDPPGPDGGADAGDPPFEAGPRPVYPLHCMTATDTYSCDGTSTGGLGYVVSWMADGHLWVCGDKGATPCEMGTKCTVTANTSIDGTCQ